MLKLYLVSRYNKYSKNKNYNCLILYSNKKYKNKYKQNNKTNLYN